MKDIGRKWHYPFHFKNKIIVRNEVGWGMNLRLRSKEANLKIPAIIQVMDDEAVVVNLRKNDRFTIYSGGRINRSC